MRKRDFNIELNKFEHQITVLSNGMKIRGMSKDDVAQEIRLRLWENKDEFDKSKSSFSTWAEKVSKNLIKNLYKSSITKKSSYLNDATGLYNDNSYENYE